MESAIAQAVLINNPDLLAPRLLAEAVIAYRAALRVRTEEAHPVEWGVTRENMAEAEVAFALAEPEKAGAHLVAALEHVEAALTV